MDPAKLIELAVNQGGSAVVAVIIFLFWRRDVKNGLSHWKHVTIELNEDRKRLSDEAKEDRRALIVAIKENTVASTEVRDVIRGCRAHARVFPPGA